jgi:hypothetical protein
MTIVRLSDRLSRLEQHFDPQPDPRRAAELERDRAETLRRILAVADALDRGIDPNNMVSRAIVANDGDIGAALRDLAAQVRPGHERDRPAPARPGAPARAAPAAGRPRVDQVDNARRVG